MRLQRLAAVPIVCIVFLQLLLGACAATTTVVATQGTYADERPRIAAVVALQTDNFEFIDVEPPSNMTGPVIIHGRGEDATRLAKDLAYALYREFGVWVATQSVELGNHRYSDDYVGVYLLDAVSVSNMGPNDESRESVIIIGSNEFVPAGCDSFNGALVLEDGHVFSVSGSQFGLNGDETAVSIVGTYLRSSTELVLNTDGKSYHYTPSTYKWPGEAAPRTKYKRNNPEADAQGPLACNFIQDVDVIERSGEFRLSESHEPPPTDVTRFFQTIGANAPEDPRKPEAQMHMQMLPAVGREELLVKIPVPYPSATLCEPMMASKTDPLDEIERLAALTRIVIINEAHDRPAHRDFIRQVAVRLRGVGYRIFAAETFAPGIETSASRPFASVVDGYYSNEPVFGDLIRTVKASGYELRHYEHSSVPDEDKDIWARADERERGQADNLLNILDSMEASDRLLVHVGYSHASEVPIRSFGGKNMAWMAARFKKSSGLDPLTIDQTKCLTESTTPELTERSARHVDGQFDLVVGHSSLTFIRSRPTYRISEGKALVNMPSGFISADSRTLIEVRYINEPDEAVPVDRLMLWPGESLPLVLADGLYRMISFEEDSNRRVTMSFYVQHGHIL